MVTPSEKDEFNEFSAGILDACEFSMVNKTTVVGRI